MKVVDFLKNFDELKYDNDTELLILLTSNNHLPKFVQIEDVCRNEDCLGYNEVGIILRDKSVNEWIKLYEQAPPVNTEVEVKVVVDGEERIYINKLIPLTNGVYIWAYCNCSEYDEVIGWRSI